MVKLSDMRVGSVVVVRGDFGNGRPMTVVVDAVEENVKNGRPGIDYTVQGNTGDGWAYLNQVDRVVTY